MTATQAVIVALPPAMDPIRLVGDEEKHATLLYFGETATLPGEAKSVILGAIGRAAKLFPPFSEEILNVSRLGSEDPPALVSMLTGSNLSKVRDVLQMDSALTSYLSNATQYPNYMPHVTLAYPDYQGEAELRNLMQSLYRVRFDRLALWWNDERIEFPLGTVPMSDVAVHSLSDTHDAASRVLAHFGVKGMHWGVRKDDPSKSAPQGVTVVQPKPGTRVVTVGGQNQPAHEDAKTAAAAKQKARASTTDALSNAELKAAVERMNLEQQYIRLSAQEAEQRMSIGKKFVRGLFGDLAKGGRNQANQAGNKVVQKKINDALLEKGLVDAPKKKK